jgi:hypothetical protein
MCSNRKIIDENDLRIGSRLQTLHHIPSHEATTAGNEMSFAIHWANIGL